MVTLGWTLLAMIVVSGIYVLLKLSKWAAPLSGALGMMTFFAATQVAAPRGMLFGAGLFAFSAALFALGGGMRGR